MTKSKTGEHSADGNPFAVSFLVVPGFSMMALSSAVEPLRAANRLADRTLYSWSVMAAKGGPVTASNGLDLTAVLSLADTPEADLTIVVASLDVEALNCMSIINYLHRLRIRGKMLGAISNGALLLARAGLPKGSKVTIHWEMQRHLADRFPQLDVVTDLYCWDRSLLTAAGGTAAMDLMLALIAERDGRQLAADVSEQFLHGPIRTPSEAQRADLCWRYQITDHRLIAAIRLMESDLRTPIKIARIAALTKVSERQLARLFQEAFSKSPSEFYMDIRIKAAHAMLLHSTASLDKISEDTGFSSSAHFSRTMTNRCGMPPSKIRRQGRKA